MVFEENIICFWHTKHMKKKPNSQDECGVGERGGIIVCGRWTRSARPRGLGGDFEFLPLKSPRNPITPIETTRVRPWTRGCIRGFERKREAPDLPPRGRGTVRRRWKEFSGGGRSLFPSLLCRTSFYFPTHSRHTRHKSRFF